MVTIWIRTCLYSLVNNRFFSATYITHSLGLGPSGSQILFIDNIFSNFVQIPNNQNAKEILGKYEPAMNVLTILKWEN